MASRRPVPASVFTSIGKEGHTTITAALDCSRSEPHYMIGAMPTMGMALSRLHSGSRPA